MQNEIIKGGKLLDSNGDLIERGYARSLIKDYSSKDVKASHWRLKEWDYYLIYNKEFHNLCNIEQTVFQ